MRRCDPSLFVGVAFAIGGRLAAQSDSGAAPAGASIAAAGITAAGSMAQHLRVLASDSLRGRGPGSSGLERTASYIADQFKALGLAPVGQSTDSVWIQRYPLVEHL